MRDKIRVLLPLNLKTKGCTLFKKDHGGSIFAGISKKIIGEL